jgi:hypothetical protein
MKQLLILSLLTIATYCRSQVALSDLDLNHLIAISEFYSKNPNATGKDFHAKMDSLQTPKLKPITDALIAIGKGDASILENRFWKRPSDEILRYWYVIRNIHYNEPEKTKIPKSNLEIAKEVLADTTLDKRWLLDNYYYRIRSGLAMYFNSADLKKHDFNLNDLGLQDKTEKAICFFAIIEGCAQRFKVLSMMKNNKKLLEFAAKMPKINGNAYYYYQDFDYEDFKWVGYDKVENYNERQLGSFYSTLMTHTVAVNEINGRKAKDEIYFNSILFEPKYFKYSPMSTVLQDGYDALKNKKR